LLCHGGKRFLMREMRWTGMHNILYAVLCMPDDSEGATQSGNLPNAEKTDSRNGPRSIAS